MTWLPIVARELRIASRRRGTYWARVAAAFGALILGGYVFTVAAGVTSPFDLGRILFQTLAWAAFLVCFLAGPRLTADCVSEERREGTLGLLFLTDLRGYDIVLGKLAATSLVSIYGVMAIVPVLAITLTLGGVSGSQIGQVAVVLLNTLLLSLSVGILVSSLSTNGRRAALVSLLLMTLITAGPFVSLWLWGMDQSAMGRPPLEWLLPSSAAAHLIVMMPQSAPKELFWPSTMFTHLLTWLAFVLTCLFLPRLWQDRPATARRLRWREVWTRWSHGAPGIRAAFRQRLLNLNPFFWLAARDRLKPMYVWLCLGMIGAVALWGVLNEQEWWHDNSMDVNLSILLHGLLRFWIAASVVLRLAEDRRSGALELLLCTPLSTRTIFFGQFRALQRQFGLALAAVLGADLWLCYATLLNEGYSERNVTLLFFAAHMLTLVADTVTIAWVGLWVAVTARHPNHAAASVLARVLCVPWIVIMGLVTIYIALGLERRLAWTPSPEFFIGLWFGFGLVNDVLQTVWALGKLRRQFRERAASRFDPGRLGWLFWMKASRQT